MDPITPTAASSQQAGHPGLLRFTWLLWGVWLAFLIYPVSALFASHPSPVRVAAVLGAAGVFAVLYAWNIWRNLRAAIAGSRATASWLPIVALALIALALTLGDRQDWIELFIFVSVSFAPALPPRNAAWAVAAVVAFMVALGLAVGATTGQAIQIALQGAVSGIAVIVVVRTVVLNLELQRARAEIARLAVNEERLRFARDLHDLLGHSLSLIALKSELAAKLTATDPERAAAEIRDVEAAARTSLHEVREAVAGYRQPTLAGELESASQVLAAAGITCDVEGAVDRLPPAREAALAWAVREAATNVIKHSRASRCTIQVALDETGVRIAVADNGRGSETLQAGSGLKGIRERLVALGGGCEACSDPEGGFLLAMFLPLASDRADAVQGPL